MDAFHELLACPACAGALAGDWSCEACGRAYPVLDGVPRLRLDGDSRTEAVRRFYDQAPFPGYPPRDSLAWLRARAEASPFAQLLDQAIPGDARIVEVGCGTGQMTLNLARADRIVVGADLTLASLQLGAQAARRFGVDRALFVETDLHRPSLREGAFDVVYSSGVVHHTPDPRAAFACIARLARPGGMIVVGLYNAVARLPLRLRRVIARLTGFRWIPFDPVLRDRRNEPARREAWLRDQYRHPEEHRHTHAEVLAWFAENDVDYVRAYPSALISAEPEDLFAPAADNWAPEAWLAQLGWMAILGGEGGLFVMVGRRRPLSQDAAQSAILAPPVARPRTKIAS
ncbi:methyltransferase domain-containing protein [Phenylobacterium sp.]|uniref:methyltransferase domain-containing protein n=1 Tax=Phenylobacterium sp. TaxID=1871053 RepID=UPI002FCA66D7